MLLKKGWAFISSAPFLPSLFSAAQQSLVITSVASGLRLTWGGMWSVFSQFITYKKIHHNLKYGSCELHLQKNNFSQLLKITNKAKTRKNSKQIQSWPKATLTFSCVSVGLGARNGGWPTNISKSMTPTLHQSQSWVYPVQYKCNSLTHQEK